MRMPVIATFSIVARDPGNGDLGVAVQSKFLAVGSVVSWARANAGAVATQALANIRYGPDGLDLLGSGLSAEETLRHLLAADPDREHRQVGLVDREGRAAAHTGNACFEWAGHEIGDGFTCQGNILAGPDVVHAMAARFRETTGELAERLIAALDAGQQAGGDRRGRQSAALYVARAGGSYGGRIDRYIDLRVDDHPDPIVELGRILRLHRLYLTRPTEDDLLPIDDALATEIQEILRGLGYYDGPATRTYDHATREALAAYGGVENLEERLISDTHVDPKVLAFLRAKQAEAHRTSQNG